ncbi:MAG: DUF6090 family protein [Kordiimonas sp.]
MILRRFTEHVRDQNWFAVALDFLVVVAGIFVGLQVTDWNQAQKNHKEGVYYLELLDAQVDAALIAGAEEIKDSEEHIANMSNAMRLLHKDDWTEEDVAVFQRAHLSAFFFWGPAQKPAALRQLVDGGKLDLINSKQIQEAILDYESSYAEAIQQTETSYSYSKDITLNIMNGIRYIGRGEFAAPAEIKESQVLKSAFRGKMIFQGIQLGALRDIQKANEQLKAKLKDYLSAPK